MKVRLHRSLRPSAVAAAVTALAVFGAGNAFASPSAQPTGTTNQYCQVLVSATQTDLYGSQKVLAKTCWRYTTQQAEAAIRAPYAGTRVKSEAAPQTTESSSLLLFSMYQNSYWNQSVAGESESIYIDGPGYIAPCDASGYHIYLDSHWSSSVSSFRQGDVSCPKLKLLNKPLTGYAEFPATTATLGGYNDNVGKVYAHA